MISENKKSEFWNFLTTEKNQARPKGITIHRLAVIKPIFLDSEEFWFNVIEKHNAANRAASEFYQSGEQAAGSSRTDFWNAVRSMILHVEKHKNNSESNSNQMRQARRQSFSRNKGKQNRLNSNNKTTPSRFNK
jgi:hypothetical protein